MSVLSSLLGRRPPAERPDLAAWIAGKVPALVVDADGSGGRFPAARILVHTTSDGPGVPFHFPDKRRLPAKDGELRALVFADVLGKVIDAGAVFDEARRALAPDGVLLVVQTLAPEDFGERAIWNAAAKMRDPQHASAPSPRQFAAMMTGSGWETLRDATWDETPASPAPRDAAAAILLADAASRGADDVVRHGAFVVVRRAFLLRRD